MPGLEEGIIPTTRSINTIASLEEERRLFYVGITRAKEYLLITHAKHRYSYGQMIDQLPSRFLREVEDLVPHEECSYWNISHINTFLSQWLGITAKQQTHVYVPTASYASHEKGVIPAPSFSSSASVWKKNQPVKHAQYGVGTVQDIEEKSSGDTYITVRFKMSIKKILAKFLQKL